MSERSLMRVRGVTEKRCPLLLVQVPLTRRGRCDTRAFAAARVLSDTPARVGAASGALGLDAHSLAREIERFEPNDWKARTRFGALSSGLGQFGERAPYQLRDLQRAINAEQPEVLFVVAVPFGRDQPEVARRVEVAQAGVRLPVRRLAADRLRDVVRHAIELRPGAETDRGRVRRRRRRCGRSRRARTARQHRSTRAAAPRLRSMSISTRPGLLVLRVGLDKSTVFDTFTDVDVNGVRDVEPVQADEGACG